jgi:hypothetical protein
VVEQLNAMARPKGLTGAKADRARRYFVARQVALALLGSRELDLSLTPTRLLVPETLTSPLPQDVQPPADRQDKALGVLGWYLQHYRELVTARMRKPDGADFFAKAPYLVAANVCKPEGQQLKIEKPSDFCDLWVREYWGATGTGVFGRMADSLAGLEEEAYIERQIDLIRAASTSLLASVVLELKREFDAGSGPAIDVLRDHDPTSPLPAGLVPPALPCLPAASPDAGATP